MNTTFLRFWGVRGSIPTPGPDTVRHGGNTSCVELRVDERIIILDAGTGIRPLGMRLADEFSGRPLDLTLLITHAHWDHIQGFPFFLPAYAASTTLRVCGFEGTGAGFRKALFGQMREPYFPFGCGAMPARLTIETMGEGTMDAAGLVVHTLRVPHPGGSMGLRVETPSGAVGYIPDVEPPWHQCQARLAAGDTPTEADWEKARSNETALEHFVRGLEVLIIDAQYTANEYPGHVGWGHAPAEVVTRLAMQAGVRKLVLFHHDPGQTDDLVEAKLASCRQVAAGSNLEIEAAREGMIMALP